MCPLHLKECFTNTVADSGGEARGACPPPPRPVKIDMNPVNAPQCRLSRGWQCVAPEVDLRKCTLHSPPQCE